jgi:hypothetical protein
MLQEAGRVDEYKLLARFRYWRLVTKPMFPGRFGDDELGLRKFSAKSTEVGSPLVQVTPVHRLGQGFGEVQFKPDAAQSLASVASLRVSRELAAEGGEGGGKGEGGG